MLCMLISFRSSHLLACNSPFAFERGEATKKSAEKERDAFDLRLGVVLI